MEKILNNSGLQPILEKVLRHTDLATLLSYRLVSKYWKQIVQNPSFWLTQLKLAKIPEEILQKWKELALKVQDNVKLSHCLWICLVWNIKFKEDYGFLAPEFAASAQGLVSLLKFMVTYTEINFISEVCTKKGSNKIITPIYCGVISGKVQIIKYFHDLGYDLNITIDGHWTPFLLAVYCSHIEVIKFFASILENPLSKLWHGRTAFHLAAENGCHESLKCLLKIFGSSLVNEPIQSTNNFPSSKKNYTALQLAVENGHIEVVEVLAEFVNNPNQALPWPNPLRSTPLKIALRKKNTKMLKVLLKVLYEKMDSNPQQIMSTLQGLPLPPLSRPNPNQNLPIPNPPRSTPLNIALSNNDSKMVKVLLKELSEKMDSNPQEVMSTLQLLN